MIPIKGNYVERILRLLRYKFILKHVRNDCLTAVPHFNKNSLKFINSPMISINLRVHTNYCPLTYPDIRKRNVNKARL